MVARRAGEEAQRVAAEMQGVADKRYPARAGRERVPVIQMRSFGNAVVTDPYAGVRAPPPSTPLPR